MTPKSQRDILRTVSFKPYRPGLGPTFKLTVWDPNRTQGRHNVLGYKLVMRENNVDTTLFEAEDFGASESKAVDSDDVIRSLMTFLTLRPGDTDADYFDGYTAKQMAFAEQHAEALGAAVGDRFGHG